MSTPLYRNGNTGGGYPSGRARVRSAYDDGGYGGSDQRSGGGGGRPYRGRPRPRWGRIILVAVIAVLLIGGVALGGGYLYLKGLDSDLQRTDAFSKVSTQRPAVAAAGAQNILLLGSDSRDPDNKAKPGQWRTDTMMVMHIDADHKHVYLISLPRDLFVYIPKSPRQPGPRRHPGQDQRGVRVGGEPLAVETVEGYTGVRVDHVVLVDFGGFQQVTDAIGGVDMNIEQTITSIHPPYRTFHQGVQHLNGAEALDYVRQRKQFAQGDFARIRHQQQFLKALMDKAATAGVLGNPFKLDPFLTSVTKAMTVDDGFSLADTALSLRNIRSADMTFLTCPNLGSQTIDGESVVVSDKAKAAALFDAVGKDQVAGWVAQNPNAVRGS